MIDFSSFSLTIIFAIFFAAAVVIALVGTRLTKVADLLADKTGLGEALVGAVMLGAATSLSGIVTSVTAAAGGSPELAISNALGGVAAQTAFLAVADMSYRNINLEHAAASVANLMQGTLLVTLLAVPLMALASPDINLFGIHPASIILIAAYLFGIRLISQAEDQPTWDPYDTPETKEDDPDESEEEAEQTSLTRLWVSFLALSALLGVAGYVVAQTGGTDCGTNRDFCNHRRRLFDRYRHLTARTRYHDCRCPARGADLGGRGRHRRQRFRYALCGLLRFRLP